MCVVCVCVRETDRETERQRDRDRDRDRDRERERECVCEWGEGELQFRPSELLIQTERVITERSFKIMLTRMRFGPLRISW